MATTETGALSLHAATTSTTAETWSLSRAVKKVVVHNRDATPIYVTVSTGRTAAAAEAGIVTAVAAADETKVVPANGSAVVFESTRRSFVAGSVIGDASDYSVEGTP